MSAVFRSFGPLLRLLGGRFPRAREIARARAPGFGRRWQKEQRPTLARVSQIIRDQRGGGMGQGRSEPDGGAVGKGEKCRTKVTVVAWDLGHNPLGRAYLLADMLRRSHTVELIGANFPRFGASLWAPLRGCSRVTVKGFPGAKFPAHFNNMESVAEQIDGDVIYVSKPRLPGLELAILAKLHRNRPIVLDIDDYELGFFDKHKPLTLDDVKRKRRGADLRFPQDETWTRFSETLIPLFEQLTVSNRELQRRYGGLVVPHARDERDFVPEAWPRAAIREALGFSSTDKVILFAGTPRLHKGLEEVVLALRRLGRGDCKLLIVGSPVDHRAHRFLKTVDPALVKVIPDVSFSELPGYLCVADLVCLLQQPGQVVSRFQMPAKFSDALAMGIPVLASGSPLFSSLADQGLLELLDGEPLGRKIESMFNDYGSVKRRAMDNREVFLRDYSYAANLPKLEDLIDRVVGKPAAVPNEFQELIDYHRKAYGGKRPRVVAKVLEAGGPGCSSQQGVGDAPKLPRAIEEKPYIDDKLDIVFFWKQNDTGIYGRRQDMLVKYLAKDARVGRIFHFDAPIRLLAAGNLAWQSGRNAGYSQALLILRQTLSRKLGLMNRGKLRSYTFVCFTKRRISRLLSRFLPSREDYADYLERKLRRHGLGQRRTVFWVCPNNFDFPALEERCKPDLVVADVIDDQRAWPCTPEHEKELSQNYQDLLSGSHLVFANCQAVREDMGRFNDSIHLFHNAVERFDDQCQQWEKPELLRRIKGPLIGYAGNLDVARIDVDLLKEVAAARPDWNLVFVGSTHKNKDVLELNKFANVHFLGVRPYDQAVRLIRYFDVAMVPHLDNQLTRHMNPLKLYVYFSLSLPVVTTPIADIGEFDWFARVAHTPTEFIDRIAYCLNNDTVSPQAERLGEWLAANSWEQRVKGMLELMETKFAKRE